MLATAPVIDYCSCIGYDTPHVVLSVCVTTKNVVIRSRASSLVFFVWDLTFFQNFTLKFDEMIHLRAWFAFT